MNDRHNFNLENSMVIGATDAYERNEVSDQQRSELAMDALCDGYWDDYLPTKDMCEQMEFLCLAVDLKQDDAAIARHARHFVSLAMRNAEDDL